MNLIRYIICLVSMILSPLTSQGQDILYEQFTTSDGLPSMTTYEMVQDSNGILWIGTEDGLVSYNGEEFKRYTHPDLKDNDIIAISLSAEGYIYFFNLSNQLGRVIDEKVELVLEFEANLCDIISTLEKEYILCKYFEFSFVKENNISSNKYKIFLLENDTIRPYSELISGAPLNWEYPIQISKEYLGNNPINRTFYIIDNDSLYFLQHESKAFSSNKNLKSFKFDNDHFRYKQQFHVGRLNNKNIGFATTNQSYFIDQKVLDRYQIEEILNLVNDENDNFIILKKGLDYFNSETEQRLTLLEDKSINMVFIDRENNLWVSSDGHGLFRFSFPFLKLKSYPERDKNISSLASTDNLILSSWADFLQVRNTNFDLVYELNLNTNKRSTIINHDEKFYVSNRKNLLVIDEAKNIIHDTAFVSSSKAMAIRNSILHSSSIDHIFCFDISEFSQNSPKVDRYLLETINHRIVKSLMYSQNQDLLLAGTPEGLFEISTDFKIKRFLPSLKKTHITKIIEQNVDSSLWIASYDEGIYHIKNEKIVAHYNTENGLLSNHINDLTVYEGKIYAASSKGVSQINPINRSIINKNSTNGLPEGSISNLCIFNDSIWLSSQKNMVVLDNSFFERQNIPPLLSINQVYVNNEEIDFEYNLKFEHDQNKIDIFLNNISLCSTSNKTIKYRIINQDSSWTTSTESVIRFNSLRPGKYIIEAKGINGVGTESSPIHFSFVVVPPWWNTFWAKLLAFLGLVVTAYIIILYRSKNIRREESVKRDYLNQINKVKDKALQLQMNPHFIFNSLNAIQGFIGTEDEEKALNYLARFARLIRMIFEHSRGNYITLEKELEFIQLYLGLEKLRFKEKVDIQLHVQPEINKIKDMVRISPLLVQPIIENSFKHGLFHKKEKGMLSVEYKMKDKTLCIIVEDNGIGRTNAAKIAHKNHENHNSTGIKTTKERLDLLNFKSGKDQNTIQIEDLYKDGVSTGTRTTLHLSLN